MLKPKAAVIIMAFVFSACMSLSDDTGINTLVKESFNGLHDKKAILFLKEAALSSNSYQVIVCYNNHMLDKKEVGNTFTVDANYDSTFLDSTSINFTWLSNNLLQIDYNMKLRTFIEQQKIDDVKIIYKAR